MCLFEDAADQWDLDRLYADLAASKRKIGAHKRSEMTSLEKQRLRGLLLKYSPADIAEREVIEPRTVEVALSQGLYRYIKMLTGRDRTSVENWRDIETWLTAAGYRCARVAINWDNMPEVPALYGRKEELEQLQRWVSPDSTCRLVAINGPAGIGKTSLAITLAKGLNPEFDGVIWQSLRHKPSFNTVMGQWLSQLPPASSSAPQKKTLESFELLDSVMDYLHNNRCLVVIDNLETILLGGSLTAGYEPGYEDYAELLKRLSEEPHQSCAVVTGRESNAETKGSAALNAAIKSVRLEGLSYEAAEQVLKEEGLPAHTRWKTLIEQYRGNPLILRIVAMTIQEMFNGDVGHFLKQRKTLFGNVEYLIAQQCDRLSAEEQNILIQLTQQAEPMQIDQFNQPYGLQAITALLTRRSLVEKSEAGFTLRPVVMEYVRRYLLRGD
ncbi:MAG: ATP-binding protein [Cyanobacteria bacterium J06598_3]